MDYQLNMKKTHRESNHSFDDTYKEKEEMFGRPYKELQDYFRNHSTKGKVLDLGCGQGRDSLFFASLGFQVTAIDISKIGVEQMIHKAKEKGLNINGIVADVQKYKMKGRFDIILFDMLLHSFENEQQLGLLKIYSHHLEKNGKICIVFPDDMNSNHFMNMINSLPGDWDLLDEIIINDVPKIEEEDTDYKFTMMVVRSIS
jgi:2-polyprenyl-3-methyl-5-hydroxy-6-metoxy-1,4-benzoquinol methylase